MDFRGCCGWLVVGAWLLGCVLCVLGVCVGAVTALGQYRFPQGLHTTARELQTCTFERPGASNTTKIQREDTQKGKKRTNFAAGEGKKRAKFWAVQGKGGPGEGRSKRAVQGKGTLVQS